MAVPVINVASITKSTMSIYFHEGGSVTSSSSYVDLAVPLVIPAVADGDVIFLNFLSYHGSTHNRGGVRLIGVTSGTVIHETDTGVGVNTAPSGARDFGVWKLTKTTGATEDIKVQVKSNNSDFRSDGWIHAGKGMANVERVNIGTSDTVVTVKTTVHIDSIDLVAIGYNMLNHGSVGCPTVGYAGHPRDPLVQTFSPNQMYNELCLQPM